MFLLSQGFLELKDQLQSGQKEHELALQTLQDQVSDPSTYLPPLPLLRISDLPQTIILARCLLSDIVGLCGGLNLCFCFGGVGLIAPVSLKRYWVAGANGI